MVTLVYRVNKEEPKPVAESARTLQRDCSSSPVTCRNNLTSVLEWLELGAALAKLKGAGGRRGLVTPASRALQLRVACPQHAAGIVAATIANRRATSTITVPGDASQTMTRAPSSPSCVARGAVPALSGIGPPSTSSRRRSPARCRSPGSRSSTATARRARRAPTLPASTRKSRPSRARHCRRGRSERSRTPVSTAKGTAFAVRDADHLPGPRRRRPPNGVRGAARCRGAQSWGLVALLLLRDRGDVLLTTYLLVDATRSSSGCCASRSRSSAAAASAIASASRATTRSATSIARSTRWLRASNSRHRRSPGRRRRPCPSRPKRSRAPARG